jgi:SAM-dependent methyltransferase
MLPPNTDLETRRQQFWTPQFWKGYFDAPSPYRRYKHARDVSALRALLAPPRGARVLEAGCGHGRISQVLLEHFEIRLFSTDLSQAMLEASQAAVAGVEARSRADVLRLPFADASFDVVLCSGVLMHVANQAIALSELARVLRPGGQMVVSGNNLLSPFALPMWVRTRLRLEARQTFKPPWFYTARARELGLQLEQITGDTLLAVGMIVPGIGISIPPAALFRLAVLPDRWIERSWLKYLSYEIWFAFHKQDPIGRA